jgi:hypothetical protein
MISPTGGLACWQAISDIRALARQAMGAVVGCSCVKGPARSRLQAGGVYATGPGPLCHHRRCATPGAWRLGECSPAVAHCLLWVVEKGADCQHVFRWRFTRDVCWNGPLTCVPCANWGLRDRYDMHCERYDRVWHLHKSGPLSDRASGQRGTDW